MRREGFTLLEVLIAVTIMTFAAVIVYSSLDTALRAWSSGLSSGRRNHVVQIALSRMSQQLKSAVPAMVRDLGGAKPAFESGESGLRFVTLLGSGGRSVTHVSYGLEDSPDGRILVYREHPWPDKDFFNGPVSLKEERLPEIVDMRVETLDDEEQPENGEAARFPDRVRITLVAAGGGEAETRSFTVEVPIRSSQWH